MNVYWMFDPIQHRDRAVLWNQITIVHLSLITVLYVKLQVLHKVVQMFLSHTCNILYTGVYIQYVKHESHTSMGIILS